MPNYLKLLLSTLHLRSNYSGVQQKTTSLFEESTYFVNSISNTIQKFGEIVDFTWFLVWNCHACNISLIWRNSDVTLVQNNFGKNFVKTTFSLLELLTITNNVCTSNSRIFQVQLSVCLNCVRKRKYLIKF